MLCQEWRQISAGYVRLKASLSNWSIVMTSPMEFSSCEFRTKQIWKVVENDRTNQEKKDF